MTETGGAIAILLAAVTGAGGVIALLFKMLIASKEKEIENLKSQLADMESVKDTFKDVAAEAMRSVVETTNYYRIKDGKPPLILPIKVVAEGSSPPKERQREAATAATMRATMVVIKEATGQEVRKEPGEKG